MAKIPLIVGFGGYNSAGRSSFFHSYNRIVHEELNEDQLKNTFLDLAQSMNLASYDGSSWLDQENNESISESDLVAKYKTKILQGTLVRKIEENLFDTDKIPLNRKLDLSLLDDLNTIKIPKNLIKDSDFLQSLSENEDESTVEINLNKAESFLISDYRKSAVSAAGQIPSGFDISKTYKSKNHPRGLQLSVLGSSDAIQSLGIDWDTVKSSVSPEQIGVYASSAMGQMDEFGAGGYSRASALGLRPTTKQMPFSFTEMPADFLNAYILGSLGYTSATVGACATFLYNLDHAVNDIQTGRRRVAIVGSSEAPIIPEIMESYRVMGALAEDHQLLELEGKSPNDIPDYRKACRPFGENCGFVIAESSQFIVLFDDELALELGANIYGAVPSVFIHADGFKKSISKPGAGNYFTMANAASSARAIIGEENLRNRTFISAHGTGTPQNRVTESHVFNEVAKAFQIDDWAVTAIKNYVGHSIGPAAGDQLIFSLGTWDKGILPGIKTIEELSPDIYMSNINVQIEHQKTSPDKYLAAFINSKGFGGNNATGVVLSPHYIKSHIKNSCGSAKWEEYQAKNVDVQKTALDYDKKCIRGEVAPIYKTGEVNLDTEHITIHQDSIEIEGMGNISLTQKNPLV